VIIDAHHHFWRYNAREYDWIGEEMSRIRRDFLLDDLRAEISAAGVDGVVSVQARQTIEETHWLLELAAAHDWIKGVVGWVPLIEPNVQALVADLVASPKLRAVRHVLQGEPDDYMLRDDFNRGVASLRAFGLRYDVLIFDQQLPAAIQLVDRHPNQVFILDHIAKPNIRRRELSPWRENIRRLAEREHAYCKLSGMVTEADWQAWTIEDLRPYVDVVLDAFGPRRLTFGSDWPVCLVASEYRRWIDTVRAMTSSLSESEQRRIFGETAVEAYALDVD
jgi:L-fuconolactonase